jgi:hypothetical protein
MQKSVLILGSGHLAMRLNDFMVQRSFTVYKLENYFTINSNNKNFAFDRFKNYLTENQIQNIRYVYVLFDDDEENFETSLGLVSLLPGVSISTVLFNETLLSGLKKVAPELTILNPAKIAAPYFIDGIQTSVIHKSNFKFKSEISNLRQYFTSPFLRYSLLFYVFLIMSAIFYFHFHDNFSLINAVYFVVTTVATVGYGDFNLRDASIESKIVGISLIIVSSVFISLIFSLVINGILNKRVQIAMGRKKYFYKDHIILCGLGRLGYFIADELFKKGNKIVIIESQNNSLNVDYFRKRNVEVYSGDARKADVLIDAGVESCQTLISVLDNDIANLEIGLVAKHYNPNIKLVLRIFDENMADIIKNKFNINLTNSMSYLTAKKFDNLFTDTKI